MCDRWCIYKGRKGDRGKKRRVTKAPHPYWLNKFATNHFTNAQWGAYRGRGKYPIHVSSPAGLRPRLLARLSVLTTSDPPAICSVGWPLLSHLCVLYFRRFKSKTSEGLPHSLLVPHHLQRTQVKPNATGQRKKSVGGAEALLLRLCRSLQLTAAAWCVPAASHTTLVELQLHPPTHP